MKALSEITKELKSLQDRELSLFIEAYASDERAGVQKCIAQANKRKQAYEAEILRMEMMYKFEKQYPDCQAICGVDEVGRGPLAGPVVAGAVILPKDCNILYLNDSKQLSEKKREELYEQIMKEAVSAAVGFADEKVIDEINILNADYVAMREAISKLSIKPDLLLNDAVHIPEVDIKQVSIIKGDAQSASIAAASIIAKVTRDHYMVEMDAKYPGYGFAGNKGYGSAAHIAAIKEHGPCEIHRRSFIGNFWPVH